MPQCAMIGSPGLQPVFRNAATNGSQAGYNISIPAQDIGPAATDRLVIVILAFRRDAATSINSATIGGVAASLIINTSGSGENTCMIAARVPTGTTAAIALAMTSNGCVTEYAVYTLTGQKSDTPVFTARVTTAGTVRSSTQNPTDITAVFAAMGHGSNGVGTTWSGTMALTEQSDRQSNLGGAYSVLSTANGLVAAGSKTVTSTTSAAAAYPVMLVAGWQ